MENANQQSLISIVIPVLNREALLPRTLDSILNQTLRPFDVILVDNGSDDDSLALMESRAIRLNEAGIKTKVIIEKRRGQSSARNAGLREVSTPYVMWFDSDDEMEHDHLGTIQEELIAHPETDLMWFDIKTLDDDGWSETIAVDDSDLIRGHLLHSTLANARYVVKTKLVSELGGFDESLNAWEDVELGTRLLCAAENGRKFRREPMVIVHPHADSVTGSRFSDKSSTLESALDLCENALRRYGREDDTIWVDVRRMILSGLYAKEGNRSLSTRLSDKVLDRTKSARNRIALGFVRDTVAYFGRGGSTIAKALIGVKGGEKEGRKGTSRGL